MHLDIGILTALIQLLCFSSLSETVGHHIDEVPPILRHPLAVPRHIPENGKIESVGL